METALIILLVVALVVVALMILIWGFFLPTRAVLALMEESGILDFSILFLVAVVFQILVFISFVFSLEKKVKGVFIAYISSMVLLSLSHGLLGISRADFSGTGGDFPLQLHSFDSPYYGPSLYSVLSRLAIGWLSWNVPLGLIVLACNWDGLIMFLFHIKRYLGIGGYPKSEMDTWRREQTMKEEREQRERKLGDIDQRKGQIQRRLSEIDTPAPSPAERVPSDVGEYKGLIGEHGRRFQERQVTKTIRATRERVSEATALYQEGANLQRAKKDLVMAHNEYQNVNREIERTNLTTEADIHEARTRMETAQLRGQAERLRLD
jgi:hypothetical protein